MLSGNLKKANCSLQSESEREVEVGDLQFEVLAEVGRLQSRASLDGRDVIAVCDVCGGAIYEGDVYVEFELGSMQFCACCFADEFTLVNLGSED